MLVVLSLFLWSGITIITGLSASVWMFLAARGLLGVTESLFMPAALALLAEAHGPRTRSFATNLFFLGEPLGIIVGGWYGSFIAQELRWRVVFLSLGLAGILYCFPFRAFLKKAGPEVHVKTSTGNGISALKVLAKVPTYRFLCIVFPINVCVLWLLYTWLPSFLYERFSLSLAEAGFTATAYLQSTLVAGSLGGAALADRLFGRPASSRFWVAGVSILLAAPCLYFIGHSPSLFLTKAATLGFGLFAGAFSGNLVVSAFDVVPSYARATAAGCLNLIGSSISGLASLMEGTWKASVGIQNMMGYGAVACLLAGVLLLMTIQVSFKNDYTRAREMEFC
jgi:MFS family permease